MHSVVEADLVAARHADLLREAERARRVAAARRRGAIRSAGWRSRTGALLIGLGEAVAGRPRTAWAVPETERCT
jgi:hypothetical protein